MKKVRTKRIRPKRAIRFFVLTLLLMTSLVFAVKTSASGSVRESYSEITVCPGDTLWEIARETTKRDNIQQAIYDIMKINQMKKSEIYAGQVLKIPIK